MRGSCQQIVDKIIVYLEYKENDYTVKMTERVNNPFRPLSREEIIHELDISEQQIKEGKCKPADEVTKSLRKKQRHTYLNEFHADEKPTGRTAEEIDAGIRELRDNDRLLYEFP